MCYSQISARKNDEPENKAGEKLIVEEPAKIENPREWRSREKACLQPKQLDIVMALLDGRQVLGILPRDTAKVCASLTYLISL